VTELDWWDEVLLRSPTSDKPLLKMDPMNDLSHVRLVCTPAQHGSGRVGLDANTTLWASWTLEHYPFPQKKRTNREPFRVFFGGDTGYQFQSHQTVDQASDSSRDSPPSAPHQRVDGKSGSLSAASKTPSYPVCPAFQQISSRLGSPDLLLLPISVGATISFLKSFDPIPPAWSPFPRIDPELNSSNHMGPEDAVRVMKLMISEREKEIARLRASEKGSSSSERKSSSPIAIGIHWGTFVSGENEIKNSIRELRKACRKRGVRFGRESEKGDGDASFILVNHGGSVEWRIR